MAENSEHKPSSLEAQMRQREAEQSHELDVRKHELEIKKHELEIVKIDIDVLKHLATIMTAVFLILSYFGQDSIAQLDRFKILDIRNIIRGMLFSTLATAVLASFGGMIFASLAIENFDAKYRFLLKIASKGSIFLSLILLVLLLMALALAVGLAGYTP